jgi:hypothetical protein
MNKHTRIVLFILLLSLFLVVLVIGYYEKKIANMTSIRIKGGVSLNKEFTADEIISMIKKSPMYIGDSITIYENGEIVSSNPKFQGTLNHVANNDADKKNIERESSKNHLPFIYNLYVTSAYFYRNQFAEEFVKKDTVQSPK